METWTSCVLGRPSRLVNSFQMNSTPPEVLTFTKIPHRHHPTEIPVLIGMSVVSCRPVSRSDSDILSGVDFLSVFMNSASESPKHVPPTFSPDEIFLSEEDIQSTTLQEELTTFNTLTTTEKVTFVKDNPSAIVSDTKRTEFSVEESDPITINSKEQKIESKVKRKSEDLLAIGANPDYIAQQQSRLHRDNIPNYNHPYHNRQPLSRSRSVSYSTVIQSLPNQDVPEQKWNQEVNTPVNKPKLEDYDYTESYPGYQNKNSTKVHAESTAESKDYFVTRKYNPGEFNESTDKNRSGHKPEQKKLYEHTERNWGIPEKNYENLPTVYGKPEENYEIDEAVSVMTNGRVHGIQNKPTEKPLQIKVGQAPSKTDDNQKVGYVVEGRNYRKYRVEERTSDGFIVGEYGVVSNNDGSLRGVRYTADGTINPRVIYDALMKFLSL